MDPIPASPLFFAVPVPAEARALAGRIQEEARRTLGPARFPAPEGLHITLAFLGRLDPGQIPGLLAMAAGAAGNSPALALRAAGTGGFPRPGRARILWLGFAPEPALAALAQRLRATLKAGGVAFDEKAFMPHLTLARFREPVDLGRLALPPQEPLAFTVDELALFQSEPAPQGYRYRRLGGVRLA